MRVIWDGRAFSNTGAEPDDLTDLPPASAVGYDPLRRRYHLASAGQWRAAGAGRAQAYLRAVVPGAAWPRQPEPCLAFVSDDGARADFHKLGPLARDGVPFTLALTRDFLNGRKRDDAMSAAEVDAMVGWGCEVAGHGVTHRALHRLGDTEMLEEIEGSVAYLREQGWPVASFAYPFGACNTKVKRAIWRLGLISCLAHGGASFGGMCRTAVPRVAFGSFTQPHMSTAEQYIGLVDDVWARRGLLVFMLHPEEPQHDDAQQRALIQVIGHARKIGMRIATLREAVAMHEPLWQEAPRAFYQWYLSHDGDLRRMWAGGRPAKSAWHWLRGDSPLRDWVWHGRAWLSRARGRTSRNDG